jgi:hypothetical protein
MITSKIGRKIAAPLLLSLALLGPSAAAPPTQSRASVEAAELHWPALEGFKSETIPFPLDFARDIVHRGLEEIRFSPGWGDPKAPDYFTYAFVWLLEPPAVIDAATLKGDLQSYFSGLMTATGREKQPPLEPFSTYVRVDRGRPPRFEPNFPVHASFRAEVKTRDAFHGGQPLVLNIDVFEPKSPVAGHLLYYFEASPHIDNSVVRDNFLKMRRQLAL